MLRAQRVVCARTLKRGRSTVSAAAKSSLVRATYRPAVHVHDVNFESANVPDPKQRIEILESIQAVKSRRISDRIRENQLHARMTEDEKLSLPVESYVPVIGGMYANLLKPKEVDKDAQVAKERARDLTRARLLLGSADAAEDYMALKEEREAHEKEIKKIEQRDEGIEDEKRPHLKANDPDMSKLSTEERTMPDDNGMFKDELFPVNQKKTRIVYIPDTSADDTPFYQAKLIKEGSPDSGEMVEVEIRGKNLHKPEKMEVHPIRGHKPARSFIDRLAYEDMTELDDYAKLLMSNPDAHDAWKNPDEDVRNQELSYASYPRHPDYADPFRVLPPLKKGCGFCKGRFWDKPLEPLNTPFIIRFLYPDGSIMRRFHTGLCNKHQKRVARTIKRARCMKVFTFKNGVFNVHTPYTLPKVWRMHLDTLRVPTPTKMADPYHEKILDKLITEAEKIEPFEEEDEIDPADEDDDEEEVDDLYLTDDVDEIRHEIERDENIKWRDQQVAGEFASMTPKNLVIERAKEEFVADVIADELEADEMKTLTENERANLELKREIDAAEMSEKEREELTKLWEESEEKLLAQAKQPEEEQEEEDSELTEEALEEGIEKAREQQRDKPAEERARAQAKIVERWRRDEDTTEQLLSISEEIEVTAAQAANEHARLMKQLSKGIHSLEASMFMGGLQPPNKVFVSTAGAAEEEAQLNEAASRAVAASRWWREGLNTVDSAMKDASITARLTALIDSAAAAAAARRVEFVKPTPRATALLLYLQPENRPPTERSIASSTKLTKLSAESQALSRHLLMMLGEPVRVVQNIEEVQALLLDKLNLIKDSMKTKRAKVVHAALKERASELSSMWASPSFEELLSGTERDVKAAQKPDEEALLLMRSLRSSRLFKE